MWGNKKDSYSKLSSSTDELKPKKTKVKLPSIKLPSLAKFPKLSREQEPLLTAKKQNFLGSVKPEEIRKDRSESSSLSEEQKQKLAHNLQFVSVDQLEEWRNYYSKKYNIEIIINGETDFGKKCNDSRIKKYHGLKDPSLCYAIYSYYVWVVEERVRSGMTNGKCFRFTDTIMDPMGYGHAIKDLNDCRELVKIYEMMEEKSKKHIDGEPLSSLPLEDLKEINNLFLENVSQDTRDFIEQFGIERYIDSLQNFKLNLTHEEAIHEMQAIQKSLQNQPDKTVAYFYTNGTSGKKGNHFEVVLISHDRIIKPVTSSQVRGKNNKSDRYILSNNFERKSSVDSAQTAFYDSDIGVLGPEYGKIQLDEKTTGYGPIPPTAQADEESCGALALKYVKNLLSKNQKQLKEFSLQIPYYDKDGKKCFFFFPSPDVLYYSQSSTYNKAMIDLLFSDSPTVPIKCVVDTVNGHEHKEFPFKTIKHLLEQAMQTAHDKGDQEVFQYNYQLYCDLPKFCTKWYERYQAVSSKRGQMVKEGDGYNLALTYARLGYHKHPEVKENEQIILFRNFSQFLGKNFSNPQLAKVFRSKIFEFGLNLLKEFPKLSDSIKKIAADCQFMHLNPETQPFSSNPKYPVTKEEGIQIPGSDSKYGTRQGTFIFYQICDTADQQNKGHKKIGELLSLYKNINYENLGNGKESLLIKFLYKYQSILNLDSQHPHPAEQIAQRILLLLCSEQPVTSEIQSSIVEQAKARIDSIHEEKTTAAEKIAAIMAIRDLLVETPIFKPKSNISSFFSNTCKSKSSSGHEIIVSAQVKSLEQTCFKYMAESYSGLVDSGKDQLINQLIKYNPWISTSEYNLVPRPSISERRGLG